MYLVESLDEVVQLLEVGGSQTGDLLQQINNCPKTKKREIEL